MTRLLSSSKARGTRWFLLHNEYTQDHLCHNFGTMSADRYFKPHFGSTVDGGYACFGSIGTQQLSKASFGTCAGGQGSAVGSTDAAACGAACGNAWLGGGVMYGGGTWYTGAHLTDLSYVIWKQSCDGRLIVLESSTSIKLPNSPLPGP